MNPAEQDSNILHKTATAASDTVAGTRRKLGWGSGAEQDRHGSHFGLGYDGLERLRRAAAAKGTGAEQDRYGAHFTMDEQAVQQARDAMFRSGASGAEQDRYQARFGLGYDGIQRVKALAARKGVGAEQERYQGHFGLDDAKVEKAMDQVKGFMK